MDIWYHVETKRLKVEEFIFNQSGYPDLEPPIEKTMSEIFKEVENLLHKQLRQIWEIKTLNQYI